MVGGYSSRHNKTPAGGEAKREALTLVFPFAVLVSPSLEINGFAAAATTSKRLPTRHSTELTYINIIIADDNLLLVVRVGRSVG